MIDINLYKRLLEICFVHKLHHVGSYFSSLEIIDEIFNEKKQEDIFILSNGHAAVAMYVVIEKYFGHNAEKLLKEFGDHPKRDEEKNIYCSTGSLGMGITVAVGRALVNINRNVYCLISDGECFEGSVWESLHFAEENKLENLKVYVNANGYAAYREVDLESLEKRLKSFYPRINFKKTSVDHAGLSGIDAHYKQISEEQYIKALESL